MTPSNLRVERILAAVIRELNLAVDNHDGDDFSHALFALLAAFVVLGGGRPLLFLCIVRACYSLFISLFGLLCRPACRLVR